MRDFKQCVYIARIGSSIMRFAPSKKKIVVRKKLWLTCLAGWFIAVSGGVGFKLVSRMMGRLGRTRGASVAYCHVHPSNKSRR